MSTESALRKYEDYLLGKTTFSLKGPDDIEKEPVYDGSDSEEMKMERKRKIALAKEKDALEIVRYAVTKILGWTPQEAMESVNADIINQLKLDKIIAYIQFPKNLSRKRDFTWVIHKAFPRETRYDVAEQILQLYERVKTGNQKRFPKRAFDGEDGSLKLAILLKDYISKNLPARNVTELYDFFGNCGKANIKMHEAKLYYAYRELYETPLDYLHESLGSEKDEFLYGYYQYMTALGEIRKNKRKRKKEEKVAAEEGNIASIGE